MSKPIYITRVTCRNCGGPISEILNLGDIYLNNFVTEGQEVPKSPLVVVVCNSCELVQLRDTCDLDRLYRQYWYKSSLNKGMIASLQNVVDSIEARIKLKDGDVVVDIGANDGTMLGQYTNTNLYKIGFDPALNLADQAKASCDEFYNTYFGDTSIKIPKAKVITAIAMFYDLEDPNTFVELVYQNLTDDGIFVIQLTDLLSILKANAFDAVGQEHLEYYSFAVIESILKFHGFEVFDLETNDVNGGSIRVYAAKTGQYPVQDRVNEHYIKECEYFDSFYLKGTDLFTEFAKRVEEQKTKLMEFLHKEKEAGKTIYALGASTKGNTLLQYYGIDDSLIPYAAEVSKDKFGRRTVGSNLLIIPEDKAVEMNPDYFLVLPWHFRDGIVKNLRKAGYQGKFIFPLPEVEVV